LFVPGERTFMALRPGAEGTTPELVWKSSDLPAGYASPIYHEGKVYGMSRVGVNCLDAKDGKLIWQQRLKGQFAASPVLADGKLYAVNEAGTTYVIELGDKPKILASNGLNDTILATPAVANGTIYLRSDGHL